MMKDPAIDATLAAVMMYEVARLKTESQFTRHENLAPKGQT